MPRLRSFLTGAAAAAAVAVYAEPASAQPVDGAQVFARACAQCHTGAPDARATAPSVLAKRSPESVLAALTAGSMRPQGGRLSGAERRAVAEYLTGRALGGDPSGAGMGKCMAAPPFDLASHSGTWTGWSPTTGNARLQPTAQAGLAAGDVPRLTLKWAFGFPDATSAWSQPTAAGGWLFVGSQNGTVYALDAQSGCIIWTYTAKGGVRTAPVLRIHDEGRSATVFLGDTGAHLYALDAKTGTLKWTRQVDAHPLARITGSPVLDGTHLYVPVSSLEETAAGQQGYECCTFRGSVAALDAETGRVEWQTYTTPPAKMVGVNAAGTKLWAPSGVGIWSSPSVDRKRNVVYVTTGNTYSGTEAEATGDAILALDPATGAIKWTRQLTAGDVFGCRAGAANCLEKIGPDYDFGTPAILATTPGGRDVILLGQKSGIAYAIDPDAKGEVIWQYRAGQGSIWGGIQWGMAVDGERVYVPVSDIRTPAPGGLHAVSLTTGERLWYQPPPPLACAAGPGCSAALISAPTLIPGVLFSGSNDGAVRAHAVADGSVIWSFDTNREFTTVNGVRANGGSIQGPGPTIVNGMVYVNAGYGDHLGRPGNVLLAFAVQ